MVYNTIFNVVIRFSHPSLSLEAVLSCSPVARRSSTEEDEFEVAFERTEDFITFEKKIRTLTGVRPKWVGCRGFVRNDPILECHRPIGPPRIVSAVIIMPKRWGDQASVTAKFDDGREKVVINYFFDELEFRPEEFVGLTIEEAQALHQRRDVAYLQS